MTSQTLEHRDPDCTGEWKLKGRRGAGTWRCTVCGATYPSTPENDRAADREFAFGVLIRNQARWARLKDLLPPPPPPKLWIEFETDEDEAGSE